MEPSTIYPSGVGEQLLGGLWFVKRDSDGTGKSRNVNIELWTKLDQGGVGRQRPQQLHPAAQTPADGSITPPAAPPITPSTGPPGHRAERPPEECSLQGHQASEPRDRLSSVVSRATQPQSRDRLSSAAEINRIKMTRLKATRQPQENSTSCNERERCLRGMFWTGWKHLETLTSHFRRL